MWKLFQPRCGQPYWQMSYSIPSHLEYEALFPFYPSLRVWKKQGCSMSRLEILLYVLKRK